MNVSRLLATAAISLLAGVACQQQEPATQPQEMRTIENVQGAAVPIEPQQSLEEVVPVPAASTTASGADRKTAAQAKEEALTRRMDLPFAPAIAMDPVDGQKVSITTLTPTTEYKDKIYYFSSDANRREFLAHPDGFVKGQLAKY